MHFWSLAAAPELWILVAFHLFIGMVLALDLGFFRRADAPVSIREAAIWSAVWIGLSFLFAAGIWQFWHLWDPSQPDAGPAKAAEFITGYLIEKSLSVDNLFVFLIIFRYFAVPAHLQPRVLVWGLIGAVILRATLILAGIALLHFFWWMEFLFGAFLVYTGAKLLSGQAEEIDPSKTRVLRFARRFLPIHEEYDTNRFWVKRAGRWYATPLPLVLLVVETTDVIFALDSIPAIFGVTRDPFIVYTSNIFAILGLRALYFLLASFLGMFRYLNVGLGVVLAFVGVKMIAQHWYDLPILWSLAIIAGILAVAVVVSMIVGPPKPPDEAPEALAVAPEMDADGPEATSN